MIGRYPSKKKNKGRYIASIIVGAIVLFLFNTIQKAYAQTQKRNEIKKEESFTRPERKTPIQPQIPTINRYQQDKVFLEYADSLYKMRPRNMFDTVERQILKGNVKFRQGGMWMYCDSAYYYPEDNSLDAFSNVKMEQGDTLFVYADKLFYNGNSKMAYLKNGPTRQQVKLINRSVTLTTDSLDYNLAEDLGWYSRWGTIDDKVNTLTSLYGEYSPKTKKAEFYHDVVLVNNKDGYTLLTDTLHYNTFTHIADIDTKTEIRSKNDTIITTLARYYTDTGNADLMSRSIILHADSAGNVSTLEGDSIIYDNETRISRVYMFRNPSKRSSPMVLTDTAQKTTLIGGYGQYNDRTKEAMATLYPLLIEYSQADSIFLRADTIKTFTYIVNVPVYKFRIKTKSGYPEYNGVPIVIIDSISGKIWLDSLYFYDKPPYLDEVFKRIQAQLPPLPESNIEEENSDSDVSDSELLIVEADSIILSDSIIAKGDSIISETITEILDPDDVGSSTEKLPPVAIAESPDSILNSELHEELIQEDVPDSIPREFHIAYAYHRGRFFKQDMQGVADSIVFIEQDSMLYLYRKPIVWSGERQVTGNRIDVHFNDSTSDWAYLPESGMISEHVDEDFYNQLSGKEIKAFFENQTLRKLDISGNVETIFLPQESDSTYNRLVASESSYLEGYFKDNKLERLKMWPEVNGTVTPIFLVKQPQKYLQRFRWWTRLRPQREWYGDRWRWIDNLGEIPDELEQYFKTPSDFGEPKSFPASRPAAANIKPTLPNPTDLTEMEDTLTGAGIKEDVEELQQLENNTEAEAESIEEKVKAEEESQSADENESEIPKANISEEGMIQEENEAVENPDDSEETESDEEEGIETDDEESVLEEVDDE